MPTDTACPAGTYTVAVSTTINGVGTTSSFPVRVGRGIAGTEIALPPGRLGVAHPITFTYSQPVAANGADRPSIRPGVSGHWTVLTPYVAVFTPAAPGFAPGATETFTDRGGRLGDNGYPHDHDDRPVALEHPCGPVAGPARVPAAEVHLADADRPQRRRRGRRRHEPARRHLQVALRAHAVRAGAPVDQ